MDELTERQKQILSFIIKRSGERGFPPTIREIGQEFHIKSTNGVNDHLIALERKGYLQRGEQKSRALVPTASARNLLGLVAATPGRSVEIPVVGRVAAGEPLLAEQNLDDVVEIDTALLPRAGKDVFGLRVKGDSMIGDGILDGDIVFVRRQPSAQPGDIVVAMIEGEATVKRFYPEGRRVRLQPSNPSMKPIVIEREASRDLALLGIVVGVFRRVASA
ncbi:MAG TPA: repressor LexA [Myxococcales bacterium]|jgi:repressor LexA|nr:repressor LexA [Myxococcales bacterium]